jgi:hypothetical protein
MESQSAKKPEHLIGVMLEDGKRHDFDTEDEFDTFIARTEHHEQVREARKAAKEAKRPTDAEVRDLKAKTGKIDSELKDLAKRHQLEPNSRMLFAKATVERGDDEPAIFDATLIFGDPGFLGPAAPVYRDIFSLRDIGFTGGVESLFTDRSLILYSEEGFNGSQYWVFVPRGGLATISNLGWFNGLAKSLRYQA